MPLVLAELPPGVIDVVVVVDNGSTDRTAEVARAGGAFVVTERRRGYGSACLAGLAALFGEHSESSARIAAPLDDDDVVVFLDADHSDYPEDVARVLEPLFARRAEFVIGSRVKGGADMRAMLPQAWFGNRLACFLMRLFFGARYSDLGPFRAIRVGALKRLCMRDRDFGWTVEMQLKAHVARLATEEVPVRYRPRIGKSKITGTLVGTLRAAWKILGWIFAWRVRLTLSRPGSPRSP
ncbi:MAG: glycosyltransferase [Planctomycetes bacterium]|nr:glycosyltransferase [Planctomycetota bacterium]